VRSTSQEAEAQAGAYQMNFLCLELTTGLYKGSFNGACPPNHQLLPLPASYPLTLCASAYDGLLRKPLPNGQCQTPTRLRIDLPSPTPVNVCYVYATGRLRLPNLNGSCGTGINGGLLVTFPSDFDPQNDTYQTLGNVDINVPANAGVLANDGGFGTSVTGVDTSGTAGTVAVNLDGSFTYLPPAPAPNAFTGDDTFTYTVEDNQGDTGMATVTIQVLNPAVWFVDSDAVDPGDGRRLTPFSTISAVNNDGSDPDNPGDFIFLYEALNPYEGGFLMEDGQTLVGQEVDLGEILANVIEGGSALQGVPAGSVPPFLVLPDVNPSSDVPLLINVDTNFPLQMANDTAAAGAFVLSDEVAAVSAQSVENTLLDRMDITGGDSTEFASDGQTGVFLAETNMTIIGSIVRGGNVVEELNGTTLQGPAFGVGGTGVDGFDSMLTVIGSTIEGGDGAEVIPLTSGAGRQLQGCCGENEGGDGISMSISDITVSDGSLVTGGNGGSDGGFGGHGISNDGFGEAAGVGERGLQGDPIDPPFISVSNSTVTGGDGGDDEGGFGGDGGAGISGFVVAIEASNSSVVTGGDGGDGGDFGGWGGNGIEWNPISFLSAAGDSALQGPPPPEPGPPAIIVTSDTTVTGGQGGAGSFEAGGPGGTGIVLGLINPLRSTAGSTLAGLEDPVTAMIVDTATVSGGDGGTGDSFSGFGGAGINVITDFFISGVSTGQSSLQGEIDTAVIEVVNAVVTGGDSGAADDAGFAGGGIVFGLPFISVASVVEDQGATLQGIPLDVLLDVSGSTVSGGAGNAGGEFGGWGGSGISTFPFLFGEFEAREADSSLQGPPFDEVSIEVSSSTVTGGPGGDGDDGNGGFGILGFFANVEVDEASSIIGGEGGDGDFGGLGGEGIFMIEGSLIVSGGSQIFGGDGGAGTSLPAPGGDGILGDTSYVEITDSSATGGVGGAGTGTNGERGGHGAHVSSCLCTLVADNATITGGNGGASTTEGGSGGEGILVEDDDAFVTNSTVTGGNGGGGPAVGASAIRFLQSDSNDYVLDIESNTLVGGMDAGGSVQTVSLNVNPSGSGSVCLNAVGNTPTGAFSLNNSGSGILGITQVDLATLSADNNGVTVLNSFGTVTFECVIVS
jgi:hypothetical protein